MRIFQIVLLASLVGCASSQTNLPGTSPSPSSGVGSSKESAVVLECVSGGLDGVMKELAWINENYPGYQKAGQMIDEGNGRVYDRIIIRRGNEQKDIYFDVTEWFGRFDSIELPKECDENPS